jgi:ATP-binding cassette, subfamily C (CFTR/MRP), member 1
MAAAPGLFPLFSHRPLSKHVSPFQDASTLSRVFFLWINPLIALGYHKPLEASDIPPVPSDFASDHVLQVFKEAWKREREQHGDQAHAGRAMYSAFKEDIFKSSLVFIPFIAIVLIQPYLVNDLLCYLAGVDKRYFDIQNGIALAIIFGVLSLLNGLFTSISFDLVSRSAMKMKISAISAVFDKSLRLSSASKNKHTTGEKVTLISADAERVWFGILFINWVWAGPVMVAASMALLIKNVGVAAVVAFVCMIILAVIQGYIGNMIGVIRRKQMRFTEERTKVINESLQVKFYVILRYRH